ncbi:MAG: hypothetical protein HN976_43575 [Lentisphaerae bacterium]|nr:hypothetical protein [Lentisphaerota bacterium]MBT7062044.1 hypothetical protein [Lentisphaerota bacterium]
MKVSRLLATAVSSWLMVSLTAGAQSADEVRHALQMAVDDARASLVGAGLPADQPISLLPLAGDQSKYVEGQLKNAVTAAGLQYVEGKEDPFWEEIMKEIEWDVRKEDILNPATLVTFGKLKATRLLLYGAVREASQAGQRVFVELELHLSSVTTKQHLWGGTFAKRYYLPGAVEGIVYLDESVRQVLKESLAEGRASLEGAGKLKEVKTVAIVPLAGDIDKYITGLVEGMVSQTSGLFPKDFDVNTLAEARTILRDTPQQADAVLYGAVRDLSRKLEREELQRKVYRVTTEVQLRIQSASTGDILWSQTLTGVGKQVEENVKAPSVVVKEELEKQLEKNPKMPLYIIGGIAAAVVLCFLFLAGRRAR